MTGNKMDIVQYINEVNEELYKGAEGSNEGSYKVTELQMHKILFFLYGRFYSQYNIELWQPNFEAWKYGPVEINYRRNSLEAWKCGPIETNYRHDSWLDKPIDINQLSPDQKNELHRMTVKLLRTSVWQLVDCSHTLNSWINNQDKDNSKISKEEIQQDFSAISF